MLGRSDVEAGASEDVLNRYAIQSPETEALLPTSRPEVPTSSSAAHSKASHFASKSCGQAKFGVLHVSAAFVLGSVACLLAQYAICGTNCFSSKDGSSSAAPKSHAIEGIVSAFAPPYVGSTEVHNFPPTKPTNAYPSLFPSNVGYAGGTPTGAEAAVVVTAPAYPLHTGQCSHQLLQPAKLLSQNEKGDDLDDGIDDFKKKKKSKFDLFRSWGNLSPWYSVERGRFGVDSSAEVPDTCQITALHFLHRHGARYPTAWSSYAGPAKFATKLHKSPELWNASGSLEFLNDWTYKLGEELLTPFGRQQLYDLGISTRMKYGFLLQNFTEKNVLPVFRTESQDRMLASAMNFAIGFFGYPFDGQYQQLITIEEKGFNNTLAPYKTCPNADIKTKSERGTWYLERWAAIYLKDAHKRLQKQFGDFDLTIEDVHTMQQLCPYETVALGYSKFCELFTEEEWEGFNYALDLQFWYGSAFGSPVARVQGIGYVQELVARLTHTPIETHNSSTNATINDNPITFPLGQSLYVDATHEVVVLNIITALNLSTLAASGTLPYTHIPKDRSFKVAELAPFATNMQFQILECTSLPGPQIRIIINDAVVPLTGIRGCAEQKDGMCPVETFVKAQKEIIKNTDWTYDCHGDWTVPPGTDWETTTGDAPRKQ
ncbi:histidine phosphatase superfamily [Crassisporium funariophilum]|nr:histidine phosphatase superfamily [Crassisporium funariophilum]